MKLVSGDMVWTNLSNIPIKYNYLDKNIECDVLIIGAGVTGAIASYYLTKENINTVMVDKNIVGYGSTRASTSILQYEIDTDLVGLKGLIGEKKAVRGFKLCEKAVYDIKNIVNDLDDDCDFTLKECFYYTKNSSEVDLLKKEYQLRKKHGFDVEFLGKEKSKKYFSFPIEGGIYSNKGAAQINPYKFTHALINKARKKSLRVYENTRIDKYFIENDHVVLKTNNDFLIKAKKVIIATGYEGKDFIKKDIVNLTRTFTIVTKPVKKFLGWFNTSIIRDNEDSYTYLRTTKDNRIIIGGEDIKIGNENSKISNLTNDDLIAKKKYDILSNKLKGYFPGINDIEIEYRFSGVFGVTKDGLPYIGEYDKCPNFYFCLGYGSNGIIYSVLGGQINRDIILNKDNPDKELFKFNR
ncbi:MAG: FAD-dependent oxidoreductase [Firmicutes bacterium]|nr:FAD-dependent oxidoreductase [Bacillota bacterium]